MARLILNVEKIKEKATWLFKPGQTLSQRVVQSGIWVGALRVSDRLFRLVRTIVLARLLAPHDFGLMGIALMAISILDTFSKIGFDVALVQKKESIDEYLDTAWVAQVVRGIILFGILFVIAPLVAAFFSAPRAIAIIRVIAFAELFKGFTNIAVVYFQKELEFYKRFTYQFSGTLVDLVVAISAALVLRNVWALIFGLLARQVACCIISYVIHPYRPSVKVDWAKARELFGFGKWVLGYVIFGFFAIQGADIFLGKVLGVTALGFYQIAFRISYLVKAEIGVAFSLVTFPAFSKLQENIPKLREGFLGSLELIAFISIPLSAGILLLAPDFTQIFLGEKWMPIVPALRVLSIAGLIWTIREVIKELFKAVNRPNLVLWMYLAQFGAMAVVIVPLTVSFKIIGTAIAVLLGVLLTIPIWWHKAAKIVGVGSYKLLRQILFPLAGAFVMGIFVTIARQSLQQFGIVGFLSLVLIGALSYPGFLLLFWKKSHYGPIGSLVFIKRSLQR